MTKPKPPKTITFENAQYPIDFTRRKYGKKTCFTWGHVQLADGTWLSLGDPWQQINPKWSEVEQAARRAILRHQGREHEIDYTTDVGYGVPA